MQVFKSLSCNSKVKILELLLKGNHDCSNAISEKINLDPSTVSRHLKELNNAGLIKINKNGKNTECIVLNKKKVSLLLNIARDLNNAKGGK